MAVEISVIVPVYNVEKYLNKCVESILRQTFRDFELILVDDGSPDHSGEMCDAWAAKDPRVRVIHKPNGGLSDARNRGLELSSGKYLCFVDSDDYIAEDMLESLHHLAEKYSVKLVCCNFLQVGEDGTVITPALPVRSGLYTQDGFWKQSFLPGSKIFYNVTWNKLYDRSLFDRVRFPVGLINEDAYVLYDIVSQCSRIAVSAKPEYYYLIRENSIMRRQWSLKNLTSARAYLTRTEKFIERRKWRFAEETLAHAVHEMLGHDYGDGAKKSEEYRAVKRKAFSLYRTLLPRLTMKRRVSMLLYFVNEPLARAASGKIRQIS